MRTLKFRAYGGNWSGKKKHRMFYSENFDVEHFVGLTKDNYEIMQFTGLFDSNGGEIYEGDIVKYTSRYRGEEMTCAVVYDSKKGQYKFCTREMYKHNAGSGSWTGFEYSMAKHIEIVGNVYETAGWEAK
jgi:uncharacterized phage protein (TIGR01671 family)